MSIAAGAALWGRNPLADSRREAILTSSRRIEGDVMVLSLDNPPPQDFNQIYGLTAHAAGVIDASVVAISEVQIESAAMPSSALLELRSLHNSRGSLPNFPGSVPSARSADLPPELAVGRLLAKRLRVEAGDSVTPGGRRHDRARPQSLQGREHRRIWPRSLRREIDDCRHHSSVQLRSNSNWIVAAAWVARHAITVCHRPSTRLGSQVARHPARGTGRPTPQVRPLNANGSETWHRAAGSPLHSRARPHDDARQPGHTPLATSEVNPP